MDRRWGLFLAAGTLTLSALTAASCARKGGNDGALAFNDKPSDKAAEKKDDSETPSENPIFDKTDKSEKTDKPKPPEKTAKADKPEKSDKSDKADKPIKPRADKPPGGETTATAPTDAEGGLLLRAKRPLAKPLVYEISEVRKQTGKFSYLQTDNYYLYMQNNQRLPVAGRDYDLVSLVRSYLDRKRDETWETGKKVSKLLPTQPDPVDLGSNFSNIGGQRCYAFDAQNNLAFRTDQVVELLDGSLLRGSVITNDELQVVVETLSGQSSVPKAKVKAVVNTPVPQALVNGGWHFLFPIFSSRAVAPGSTWAFKIPAILASADGSVHPGLATMFQARVSCTLRELRGNGADQVAVIDYKYTGEFDSQGPEFKERFSSEFGDNHHVIHSISGTGAMTFDTARGIMLQKTEETHLAVITNHIVPQPENKEPKQLHEETTTVSTLTMKWLEPGTMMRNRVKVPPLE